MAQTSNQRDYRFGFILLSLCLCLFLSALEFTAVATALPTIIAALHGNAFIWVGSAYGVASAAIIPLTGGFAQLFGRGPAVIPSVGMFALGSAICGAAHDLPMMIAGRTVQGLGSGGIFSYSVIILGDLVPLEERGIYSGLFGLTWSLAAALGPVLGGVLANSGQWRWLFYLNLPICGVSAILAAKFIHLPKPPGTVREKLAAMDWMGNFLVMASTCSITIGLSQGGVNYPWDSPRILSPLVLGLVGLVIFMIYEALLAKYPLVPFSILNNRTSICGFVQTFVLPITIIGAIYYVPVYFQACKDADALKSGVLTLGLASIALTTAAGGISVKIYKCYRPQIWIGWTLQLIGMSLMTTIKLDTPTRLVVGYCVIFGAGGGFNYAAQMYAVQAPLPVSANAHAIAFIYFLRQFAAIWGVTVGGAILQNGLSTRLPQAYTSQLPAGVEIAYSAILGIRDLPPALKDEVRHAFIDSLRDIWIFLSAASGFALLFCLGIEGLPLHKVTDEAWALKDKSKGQSGDEEAVERARLATSGVDGESGGMADARIVPAQDHMLLLRALV